MAPASKTAYDAAVERVENATAIAIDGHDSLLELGCSCVRWSGGASSVRAMPVPRRRI